MPDVRAMLCGRALLAGRLARRRACRLLGLGQVLLGHRGAREPLLVELLPGAVLHGCGQALVQGVLEGGLALRDGEAGGGVEGRDVGGADQPVLRLVGLGGLVVQEVRVDGAAVDRGDRGVVVREADQVGRGEVLDRVGLLQRSLDDAEPLAGEAVGVLDARGPWW